MNYWLNQSNWTAYYAPREDAHHVSGFKSKEEAKQYAKNEKHLDPDAWFFMETKYFNKCNDFDDVLAASGWILNPREEYIERCNRIGCPIEEKKMKYNDVSIELTKEESENIFGIKLPLIVSYECLLDKLNYSASIYKDKTGPLSTEEISEWREADQVLNKLNVDLLRERIEFFGKDEEFFNEELE